MKLKYYLRGLGIGIVVTAIIMSFTGKPEELTDAEIKVRAIQLGMVEKNILADIQEEKDAAADRKNLKDEKDSIPETEALTDANNMQETAESLEETPVETSDEMPEEILEETPDEMSEEILEETISETDTESNDMTENENDADSVQPKEDIENYIIISVNSGNGSEVVSQRVFEAGLVNSAAEYNRYLVANGYDRRLRVGNHEIPAGSTEEEIAKILCGVK